MRPLRVLIPLFALGCLAFAAGCGDDDDDLEGTLFVENQSDFAIVELFVTEVDNPDFGPNLLGSDPLLPGESITLAVQCDVFDALLIDEAGVDCEINAIDLCFNNADWIIRNDTCTVFGANAAKQTASRAPQASAATP